MKNLVNLKIAYTLDEVKEIFGNLFARIPEFKVPITILLYQWADGYPHIFNHERRLKYVRIKYRGKIYYILEDVYKNIATDQILPLGEIKLVTLNI